MSDKLTSLDRLKDFKTIENGMVAYIEDSSTATRAHPVGDPFYYLGILRIATADIAVGGTIVPDTNCREAIVMEELGKKASADGKADDLVAGTADGLLADTGVNDQEPYIFRKAPDKASRLTDKIVGGTIAWNQKYNPDNFTNETVSGLAFTKNADGSITVNGTATARSSKTLNMIANFVGGHKYYVGGYPRTGGVDDYMGFAGIAVDRGNGGIYSPPSELYNTFRFDFSLGAVFDNVKFYPQVFDITQMFGSAIADQILAMETATAGAGVAFFKSLFPKPYYAYNAGELMSVNTSAHVTTGFNQWDEEWEAGAIDSSTGEPMTSSANIRCKNYITVFPNASYYFCNSVYDVFATIAFYDSNKTFLNAVSGAAGGVHDGKIITSPGNARYMKFSFPSPYGETYRGGVCINLSSERNGTYEPYDGHTYPLDASLTLRGIPKLDANNKVYYDGDTYQSDGKVTRRYGIMDMGAFNWAKENDGIFYTNATSLGAKAAGSELVINALCSNGKKVKSVNSIQLTQDGVGAYKYQTSVYMYYGDSSVSTGEELKTALNGVYLVYELATPTTETADPFINPQICSPYGTEEYVDSREVAVPVGHDTFYHTDLKGRIEGLPDDFSTLIAPKEVGFTATRAYTAKQFLIINNQLYKVTANIANGATITVGTNVTATTIGEILATLI